MSKLEENADIAAALLSLLANGKRLTIVEHLLDNEMSVGAIAEKVDLSQSALSQHLARLRRDRLVRTRRAAQTIYYALDGADARAMLNTLHQLYCRDCTGTRRETAQASEAPRLLA